MLLEGVLCQMALAQDVYLSEVDTNLPTTTLLSSYSVHVRTWVNFKSIS